MKKEKSENKKIKEALDEDVKYAERAEWLSLVAIIISTLSIGLSILRVLLN